jgi:hypothetical protein
LEEIRRLPRLAIEVASFKRSVSNILREIDDRMKILMALKAVE